MRSERMSTLSAILNNEAKIIIAPVAALKRILPPKNISKQYQLTFIEGDSINLPQSLDNFVTMGYTRVQMFTAPGELSVRGGIIDIYPMTERSPMRVVLFEAEVASTRYLTQDSHGSS